MDQKTAIVTGASQGIGVAIARAYLREGFNVVASSRHITYSSELPETEQLLLVQADVSNPSSGELLVAAAVERFGSVDVLVNNAGQFSAKPFTSYTESDDAALTAVNINGFLLVTRAVVRHMIEQNVRGNVITITASLAQQPLLSVPSAVPALTKGGLEAATRSLAIEYAARGIRFNVIAPGIVDTPMHQGTPREFLDLSPQWAWSLQRTTSPRLPFFWQAHGTSLVRFCMSMAELTPVAGRSAMGKVKAPSTASKPLLRSEALAEQLGCTCPILLAPMAGVSGTALSAAVMKAGGVGGCGAVNLDPTQIEAWAGELRAKDAGPFQINLWVPGAPHPHNPGAEEKQREFLRRWGPEPYPLDSLALPNYEEQCRALLEARPKIASSMMGLFASQFVEELKSAGIAWWATVTTVAEARQAVAAGADALIVQGLEAGGHRGCFDPKEAVTHQVGLFALLPQVCDAVPVPVIAAGGIADGRTVAAALILGASAVQVGTAFLRTDEAGLSEVYCKELSSLEPHNAVLTAAFSGRYGRVVNNSFVRASREYEAQATLPFPKQFVLTRAMREKAALLNDPTRIPMWVGQSAALSQGGPAERLVQELWRRAQVELSGDSFFGVSDRSMRNDLVHRRVITEGLSAIVAFL